MKESAPEHTFKGNLSVLDVVMITASGVTPASSIFVIARWRSPAPAAAPSVVSDRRLRRRRHRAVLCRARRRTPQRRR